MKKKIKRARSIFANLSGMLYNDLRFIVKTMLMTELNIELP